MCCEVCFCRQPFLRRLSRSSPKIDCYISWTLHSFGSVISSRSSFYLNFSILANYAVLDGKSYIVFELLRDIDTATSERLRWYDCVKNLSISKKPHRRDISATGYGPLAIQIIPALLVPFDAVNCVVSLSKPRRRYNDRWKLFGCNKSSLSRSRR
jgi:hypothetical protein